MLSNIQKSRMDRLHLAVLMGEGMGGAPFFFPIKSPPALSQGDKSTALFPQDAFSGCEFVAGDVLCAEQFFFP